MDEGDDFWTLPRTVSTLAVVAYAALAYFLRGVVAPVTTLLAWVWS